MTSSHACCSTCDKACSTSIGKQPYCSRACAHARGATRAAPARRPRQRRTVRQAVVLRQQLPAVARHLQHRPDNVVHLRGRHQVAEIHAAPPRLEPVAVRLVEAAHELLRGEGQRARDGLAHERDAVGARTRAAGARLHRRLTSEAAQQARASRSGAGFGQSTQWPASRCRTGGRAQDACAGRARRFSARRKQAVR